MLAELRAFVANTPRPGAAALGRGEGAVLRQVVLSSAGEAQRLEAGYRLGHAARTGDDAARRILRELLWNAAEEVRRAAGYGLGAGGAAALPVLLGAIGGTHRTPLPHSSPLLRWVDPTQATVVLAVAALGQITEELDAAQTMTAVRTLIEGMERAKAEIVAAVAKGLPGFVRPASTSPHPSPSGPLYFPVIERRRMLAEGCVVLGRLGQRARRLGECEACLIALEALVGYAEGLEVGLEVESYLHGWCVRGNAAAALCRLFSGGSQSVEGWEGEPGIPEVAALTVRSQPPLRTRVGFAALSNTSWVRCVLALQAATEAARPTCADEETAVASAQLALLLAEAGRRAAALLRGRGGGLDGTAAARLLGGGRVAAL